MRTICLTVSLCALALSLAACDKAKEAATPAATSTASTAPTAPAMPPPHGQAGAGPAVSGKVLETMDSGGYTYLRLATASGDQWAAVTQAKLAVGDTVTIANAMEMRAFESKTLGRTFDVILFGTLGGGSPATPAANPHGADVAAGGAPATGKVALDTPIARAEGPTGRTIAEVFAEKAALVNKPVAIRGKVTKYNGNIMGKNWIHLQDGSGGAAQNDFDLTVTTAAVAAVGDVVVVRGVVHTDKDFGAGYAYALLVEDATLEK